jgi:hypothetical protein
MIRIAGFTALWLSLDLGLCVGFLKFSTRFDPLPGTALFAGIQLILLELVLIANVRGSVLERLPTLKPKEVRSWIGLGVANPFGWVLLVGSIGFKVPPPRRIVTLGIFLGLILLATESSPIERFAMNPMTVAAIQDRDFDARLNQWEAQLKTDPKSYLAVDQRWAFYDQLPIRSVLGFTEVQSIEKDFLQGLSELSREEASLQMLEISLQLWEKYRRDSKLPRYQNPFMISGAGGILMAIGVWMNQEMEDLTREHLRVLAREQIEKLESSPLMDQSSRLLALKGNAERVFGSGH